MKTSRTWVSASVLVEQRVHEEVDVALAVTEFDVGETVVLFGQREHGLGEEGDGLDVDGQFAGAGSEQIAGDSDVVAEVEQFIEFEGLVADCVFANVDLQAHAVLLELRESRLALGADRHDASGDYDVDALASALRS